ncbi:putative protein arginine N-methyltransferase 3 [Diplonema papillatum]|nr:putative protein arginine N-methyltransferase 3 [Diplonema papillatum]|eukprot:gene7988-12278_t
MAAQEPEMHVDDEDKWSDYEGDGADLVGPTKCLLTDDMFDSATLALAASEEKGLKFAAATKGKSTYIKMKVVNFVREAVSCGKTVDEINASLVSREWEDDKYLKPFLENDPLLFTLDDESDDGDEVAALQAVSAENAQLKVRINDLLASLEVAEAKRSSELVKSTEEDVQKTITARDDEDFFEGYAKFDIHMTMLSDVHRTATYRSALCENPSLMSNAVVIDVGCGTGILSMFSARGGAARVYAIDASKRAAECARKVVAKNKLQDVVHVLSSTVEAIDSLPDCPVHANNKADVIVSEWMGYCLLFESMFYSVIDARDRFLKPGGAVLPDIARMFAAGVTPDGSYLAYWNNVWGFDMTPIAEESKKETLQSAIVTSVEGNSLATSTSTIQTFDLTTVKAEDLEFTSTFVLRPQSDGSKIAALVLWFDTEFSPRFCPEAPVTLTTSPYAKATHWHQTMLHLKSDVLLSTSADDKPDVPLEEVGKTTAASSLNCVISIVRGDRHKRQLDISLAATPTLGTRRGVTQMMHYTLTTDLR